MSITVRTLVECLQQDDKDLKNLETTLLKEREALEKRDLPLLEKTVKVKTSLLTSIEQRAKQKTNILIQLGYSPNTQTLDEFLASLNNAPLLKIWAYIRRKLANCKQLNAINGKVVSHSQMRVNKMMQIVRGQNSQPALYSAKGKELGRTEALPIASV